jgi:hypothetical protein
MSELKKALTRTDVTKELQEIREALTKVNDDGAVLNPISQRLFDLQMKVANAKVIR